MEEGRKDQTTFSRENRVLSSKEMGEKYYSPPRSPPRKTAEQPEERNHVKDNHLVNCKAI